MKRRLISWRLLGLAFVLCVMIYTLSGVCSAQGNRNDPVSAVSAIVVPGNPITSSDISWADSGTQRYYFADRSNFGVDIIDAVRDVWVGRVVGMAGPLTSGGGTSTTNGPGPNGVVVTPQKRLWAGDGNATVQVADVDPASPTYLQILHSVSTNLPVCDNGTLHYCGRADEIDYDPVDHIILIANPSPIAVTVPHVAVAPYATFINADPPYNVLGHITFPMAGGLEQPRWSDQTRRFLLTVPGQMSGTTVVTPASIAVLNPLNPASLVPEKVYPIDCQAIAGVSSASATGIVVRPNQNILVSACGFPIILSLDAKTNAINVIQVISQVGGGDQVWYNPNPGDGRFYVTGADMTMTTNKGLQSLGVINGNTNEWLENVLDVRGKNPAALADNNHIFTIVQITTGIAAAPSTDNSICATGFNIRGTGCVAVFTHNKD